MTRDSDKSWWRRTRFLAISVLCVGGGLSLIIMLSVPALDAGTVAGIPNGLLCATLLVPVFLLLLTFWSAERQGRIDRTLGHSED